MTYDASKWTLASGTRQVVHYLGLVFRRWKALGFVGGIGALIGMVLLLIDRSLPWWGWSIVIVIALFTAQYEAFRDAMTRWAEATDALVREQSASREKGREESLATLTRLVTHGEALVDSLMSKAGKDPAEGDAAALEPAVEAWTQRCRATLQRYWPEEASAFDASSDRSFADTFFFGSQTAKLLGFLRPRVGNLKAILIRVS